MISIHAPREGGDDTSSRLAALTENFNPRPPRGGRPHSARLSFSPARFQSTPPARGATPQIREGIVLHVFQSTPPARGATQHIITHRGFRHISIHAPREGGDSRPKTRISPALYFNPRPPRGGRPVCGLNLCCPAGFQSTPPARGATYHRQRHKSGPWISIHAPREGGDHQCT